MGTFYDPIFSPMQPFSFIIITGLSGSGKGTFLRALEDRGYFCVDNLPVSLLAKFYELVLKSDDQAAKAALVIDVREGQTLSETTRVLVRAGEESRATFNTLAPNATTRTTTRPVGVAGN